MITYSQTLQMVLSCSQPRVKKYSISSAVRGERFFGGKLRSSGEVALVGASDATVGGGRVAEEGTNDEAEDSLDDSCLSTLSKSNSSPESSGGCRGRGRAGFVCPLT